MNFAEKMTLAEPMVDAGRREIRAMNEAWLVKTKDRSLAVQFEQTVLVTEVGYGVLTLPPKVHCYLNG